MEGARPEGGPCLTTRKHDVLSFPRIRQQEGARLPNPDHVLFGTEIFVGSAKLAGANASVPVNLDMGQMAEHRSFVNIDNSLKNGMRCNVYP